MKALLFSVLAAMFALASCGEDVCEKAANKIKDCGLVSDSGDDGETTWEVDENENVKCEGAAKCAAECVNDASCDVLKAAFTGETNSYMTCLEKCY
ncbi:MAG: hypothetical protein JW841_09320 [Deltaproteobacteria bacterium]|nr:hypothetical protein [Deltaproteobacteria bacterium]